MGLFALYEAIYFWIYLVIFRFARRMRQGWLWVGRNGGVERTVLLVGDGLAEGVGDNFANGGLASRLGRLMAKERDDKGLKMRWLFASCGWHETVSDDWTPGVDRPPERHASIVRKSLYVDTFVDGKFRDADVILILLGGEDERLSVEPHNVERTVSNIKALSLELARKGKQVVIGLLPTYGNSHEVKTRIDERNRQIRRLVEDHQQEGTTNFISLGPETPNVTSQGGPYVDPVREGVYTISPLGYRLLARLAFDSLINPCRRVEWAYWRPRVEQKI